MFFLLQWQQIKLESFSRPSGQSIVWIHGDHTDWCRCARISLLGRRLCLHQETTCSTEEEKTRLRPGLQRVRVFISEVIRQHIPSDLIKSLRSAASPAGTYSPVWPRASKQTPRKSTPLRWACWLVQPMTSSTHRSDRYGHAARSVRRRVGLQRRRGRSCAALLPTFLSGRHRALITTPSGKTTGTWTMRVSVGLNWGAGRLSDETSACSWTSDCEH